MADNPVTSKRSDEYGDEESEKRLQAALRGSRIAGHKPMADIPKKQATKPNVKRKTAGKQKPA